MLCYFTHFPAAVMLQRLSDVNFSPSHRNALPPIHYITKWRNEAGQHSHSSNKNFNFQNSSNANAKREIYFISWNVMHRFRSTK